MYFHVWNFLIMVESICDFEVLEKKRRDVLTQASVQAFKLDKYYAELIEEISADFKWLVFGYSCAISDLSWSWRRRKGFRQHGLLGGPIIFMSRDDEPDI